MDFVEEEEVGSISQGKLMIPNSSSSSFNSQIGSWLGNKHGPKEDHMELSQPPPQQQQPFEKEHMFDKVVTPSDVGKLNRLVIPKQHAEKFFPIDSTTNEKGLLLNFEDRNGKPWRFRYSYWNSSQSYVMTKGWSRFVKDKKLDAGDIVSFQRGIGESGKHRLYIDWRRPPDVHPDHNNNQITHWSPLLMRPPPHLQPHQYYCPSGGGGYGYGNYGYNPGGVYMRSGVVGGGPQVQAGMMRMQWGQYDHHQPIHHVVEPMVYESVPVVQGKAAAKRLRLFGVNMDCPISETNTTGNADDGECDILSSTSISHAAAPTILNNSSSTSTSMSISSPSPPRHRQLLKLYNGTPLQAMASSSSSGTTIEFVNNKGSVSSSGSLNLDI